MKKILSGLRPIVEGLFVALVCVVMLDFFVSNKEFVYPSSQKLEQQGFKKLPGETPQEHEQRGRSVIDFARSIPG